MVPLNTENTQNDNNVASIPTNTMTAASRPDSVVDLLECQGCKHLVPAQNMAIHESHACQPRKLSVEEEQQQQKEQTPLTQPLLPAVVDGVSPVAAMPPSSNELEESPLYHDDVVILPPPAPLETEDYVLVDDPTEEQENNDSGGNPIEKWSKNLWKSITDAWDKWTSCDAAASSRQQQQGNSSSYPGQRRGAEGQQVDNNNSERASTTPNVDIWSCPRCTLENPNTQQKCEACQYKKPTAEANSANTQSSSRNSPDASSSNNTPSPGNFLSGGALLGGALGMAGAALTGQSPVAGLLEGAMNGAVTGAMVGSAVRTQEQLQQQQRNMAAATQSQRGNSRYNRRGPVRVISRQMPNGNMAVLSRPGGRGPIMIRRIPMNASGDPLEQAMMESLVMGGGRSSGGVGHPSVDGMNYDQLVDAFGTGNENLGANRQQIRTLPSSKVKDPKELPEDCRECPICLESFQKGSKRKTLPCLHGFHENCVDQWLRTNAACPICKHRIDE